MSNTGIIEFYRDLFGDNEYHLDAILPKNGANDLGHFNVFDIATFYYGKDDKTAMTYNRRLYYKISLIKGKNLVEYADKTVMIENQGILFATPKIPYRYTPQSQEQSGFFCVFTKDFLSKSKTGLRIDELPIYQPTCDFVYQLNDEQYQAMELIFKKMDLELSSKYVHKYDLLRNYVIELIHAGQKLTPIRNDPSTATAAGRVSALFIELLERQFPIENKAQVIQLRSPAAYSTALGVHTNHLNKVLKQTTGKCTTEIINGRITEEAKVLLKNSHWNVSEIAYALGFEEVAHFSNFFKKHTLLSPMKYRS